MQPTQPPSPARRAALSAATAREPRSRSTAEPRRPPLGRHQQLPLPRVVSDSVRPDSVRKAFIHPADTPTKAKQDTCHVKVETEKEREKTSEHPIVTSLTKTFINQWPLLPSPSSPTSLQTPSSPESSSRAGDLPPASCLDVAYQSLRWNWARGH